MGNNLASSLQNIPHLAAFDKILKERFDNLDMSAILMYLIDTSPEPALYHLADQFNVLGYNGWLLAQTVEQKRSLIKNAIKLSSKKGTGYAIKEILKSVGFIDPELIVGVGIDHDGSYFRDGTITYGGGNWATFRAKIGIPDGRVIDEKAIEDITKFIAAYKSQRDHLLDITFKIYLADAIDLTEFLEIGEGTEDTIFDGAYYDGSRFRDGTITRNKGNDSLNLRIIDVTNNNIISDETI